MVLSSEDTEDPIYCRSTININESCQSLMCCSLFTACTLVYNITAVPPLSTGVSFIHAALIWLQFLVHLCEMVFERVLIVLLACSDPACEARAACDEKRKPGSCFRLDEAIRAWTAAWTQAETEGQTKGQTGTDRGTDGGTHRGVQYE